jgi:hypothetical protein
MSARSETPIFPERSNATPVSEIAPPAPDPRRARVSKVHAELAKAVKDGGVYRPRSR